LEQLLVTLQQSEAFAECTARAGAEAPRMKRAHAFVNVAAGALGCRLASGDTGSDAEEQLAREALALPAALEDDRYSIYDELIAARRARHDVAGVHTLAAQYLADIEAQPSAEGDR